MNNYAIDNTDLMSPAAFRDAATQFSRCDFLTRRTKERSLFDRRRRNGLRKIQQQTVNAVSLFYGTDEHCAEKLSPYVKYDCTEKEAYEQVQRCGRFVGFLESAGPKLRKLLIHGSRYSRTGLTLHVGVDPVRLFDICPSPGRWERWVSKAMTRAAKILAAWDTCPSYSALARYLEGKRTLPRPHKAAIAVVAGTLEMRFGSRGDRWIEIEPEQAVPSRRFRIAKHWEVIDRYRVYRSPGEQQEEDGAVGRIRGLNWIGDQGDDDRVQIVSHVQVCRDSSRALIREEGSVNRLSIVQAVVRCPTTGQRHHLTVPPEFGVPLLGDETPQCRIDAAVAWTFGMTPDEYRKVRVQT